MSSCSPTDCFGLDNKTVASRLIGVTAAAELMPAHDPRPKLIDNIAHPGRALLPVVHRLPPVRFEFIENRLYRHRFADVDIDFAKVLFETPE